MTSKAVSVTPKTQSAWIVTKRGHPSQAVVLKNDYPVPSKLKPGQVLVKVHAAALNPVGWKFMGVLPNFVARRPNVAEHDFAGSVVDSNGTDFQKGEEVFGWIPVPLAIMTGQGALAQFVRISADHLAPKPTNINFVQVAGVALAGLTALQGIGQADLESGQTIFINGGTTAVGSFVIQIAKSKGYKVVATCSTRNVDIVKGLGADEVIDYKVTPIIPYFKENPPSPKFHAVYDTVGTSADLFTASPSFLDKNGIFLCVGISSGGLGNIIASFAKTSLWPIWLGGIRRKYRFVSVRNEKKNLESLRDFIAKGNVTPLIDSTYDWEQVHQAYERIMTGRARGKVVVEVDHRHTS